MNEESKSTKNVKRSPKKGPPRKDIKRKYPLLFEDKDLDRTKKETNAYTEDEMQEADKNPLKSYERANISTMPLRDSKDYGETASLFYRVKMGSCIKTISKKRLLDR